MTILELFKTINENEVCFAYEKMYPYEIYDWKKSRNVNESLKSMKYVKNAIRTIKTFYVLQPNEVDDKKVYVIELESTDLQDKNTSFLVFTLDDEKEPLSLETQYEIYGKSNEIAFTTDKEKNNMILNYEIAPKSLETYGNVVCATAILHSLIIWGYGEENISKNIDNVVSKLEEAEKDVENGNVVSGEEVEVIFARLRENLLEECNKFEKGLISANEERDNQLEELEEEYRELKEIENAKLIMNFVNN